jgi:mono/diheme cytochrome c family protein
MAAMDLLWRTCARVGLTLGILSGVTVLASAASARDGLYTEAQAGRGKGLYRENCMACHGDRLQGSESSPSLAGAGFFAKWGKRPVGDLYGFINAQMPLGRLGILGAAGTADVVAYILSANKMPTGEKALPVDVNSLNKIRLGGS